VFWPTWFDNPVGGIYAINGSRNVMAISSMEVPSTYHLRWCSEVVPKLQNRIVTSPDMTSPEVASPEMTSSEVASPN
jgi:hypothetical protein